MMKLALARIALFSFSVLLIAPISIQGTAANSHWEVIGGGMTGSPSIASWAADRRDVFARVQDNQIYWKFYNGVNWSDWISLQGAVSSSPDCVAPFPTRIDCVVNGPNNTGVFHKSGVLTGNGMLWTDWESLGGLALSAPTIASILFSDGHLELQVFVRGPNESLWTRRHNGQAWGNWVEIANSALFTGNPDCVYKGLGDIDCAMRSLGDTLIHNSDCCLTAVGAPFENLGGELHTSPSISSWAADNLNIVVGGPGDTLWLRTWDGDSWSDWNNWDPEITLSSAPDCTAPSQGNLYCVITDANGNVLFDNLLVE